MRQFDHLIWDWNGTIVDDSRLCLTILNEQLTFRGRKELSLDYYRENFCFPLSKFYQDLGLAACTDEFSECNKIFHKEYNKRRINCKIHDGVLTVLDKFITNGGAHSVLSAYAESYLKEMVGQLKLSEYFAHIIGLQNIDGASKVDPGHQLMERLGLKPSRVAFIGDSVHDYEVASAIGVQCFLIAKGHQSRKQLESCKAVVLDSHQELLSYI
ncbi:HAD hydrolase-like protein [Chitinispirillales bacterium ANBcel5]|uniref:HAD family hydrolase n=1 Tax=Cellulosispirillum alkaliphilum TaxID=3039283 RepID=UPI002A4F5937|nr:HAD hydrolase-like protein [Chitinispirillales bacterium ANBcel5]